METAPVAEDNLSAIEWVKNKIDHKRTEHIDVNYLLSDYVLRELQHDEQASYPSIRRSPELQLEYTEVPIIS